MNTLQSKKILLIISGGIAAYKSLELIRLLKKAGAGVGCILTQGGAKFITPLSVSALSGEQTHTDLWSLKDETEMGHIRLSRESDLIVVAPASASFIAKMAFGLADDLATTVLLAADKPVLVAPAMNHMMWNHPATQENIGTLMRRGVKTTGPCAGDMACGETGIGRMAEPEEILTSISAHFERAEKLSGLRALVTSGPTFEPVDPVRFIGNRSSGKQGHAIAAALASRGADVTLVSGPTALPDPASVKTIHVETADEMMSACRAAAPVDIAICAAAVADWKPAQTQKKKIKKGKYAPPALTLTENSDILSALAQSGPRRPRLVIGFAAETENLLESAHAKRIKKKCDWIVANNVGTKEKIFGSDGNHVYLITASGQMEWSGSKKNIADRLVLEIMDHFKNLKLSEAAE